LDNIFKHLENESSNPGQFRAQPMSNVMQYRTSPGLARLGLIFLIPDYLFERWLFRVFMLGHYEKKYVFDFFYSFTFDEIYYPQNYLYRIELFSLYF